MEFLHALFNACRSGRIILIMVSCLLSVQVMDAQQAVDSDKKAIHHDFELFLFETKGFPGIVNLFRNQSAVSGFGYTLHAGRHGFRVKANVYQRKDNAFEFYSYVNRQFKIQTGYQYRVPFNDLQLYPFLDILYDRSSSKITNFSEPEVLEGQTWVSNTGYGSEIGIGLEYGIGRHLVLGVETSFELISYRSETLERQISSGKTMDFERRSTTLYTRYNPFKALSLGFRF